MKISINGEMITLEVNGRKPFCFGYFEMRRLICAVLVFMPDMRKDILEWLNRDGPKALMAYLPDEAKPPDEAKQ